MKLIDLLTTISSDTSITVYVYGNARRFQGTVESYYKDLKYFEVKETKEMKVEKIKPIDYNELNIYLDANSI